MNREKNEVPMIVDDDEFDDVGFLDDGILFEDDDPPWDPIDLMDWGLCPHGVPDDGDCEECPGGPAGWDGADGW